MKKNLSLIISLCATILFASCNDSDTVEITQWQLDNEAQFAKISANSDYTKIESQSKAGYIMVKVLESGDGETPLFTDQVKVLYTGWFKLEWGNNSETVLDANGNNIPNKYVFDSTTRDELPATFPVSGLVDGFRTALQHMKVGDKWEIWIPWKLGYGETMYNNTIPGYTTMVYEVELVSIVK